MLDAQVIVIGGGPGGSAAAKKCAENGLKTLLLEKQKLPRDKSCGGFFFVRATPKLVEQEFGEMPSSVFSDPAYFAGYGVAHGLGPDIRVNHYGGEIASIHRKEFDYWLNQKAGEKGAEIRDESWVTSITEEEDGYTVEVEMNGKKRKLKSKFIIGADGAKSRVRSYLYPDYRPRFAQTYQELYEGDIERLFGLAREDFHGFSLQEEGKPILFAIAGLLQKGDCFRLELSSKMGEIKEAIATGKRAIKNYGIDLPEPIGKLPWLLPGFYKDLFSGSFRPAKGNTLLIGDAAGLLIPVTGEGMVTAMMGGFSAANAIVKALESGEKAEGYYMKDVGNMLEKFKPIYPMAHKVREESTKGADAYGAAQRELWDVTRNLFLDSFPG